MSMANVQEEAALAMLAKTMQNVKEAGADLTKLIETASVINDPSRGNYLNMFT